MKKFLSNLMYLLDDAIANAEALYYKAGQNVAKSLSQSKKDDTFTNQIGYNQLTKDNYKYWDVVDEINWKNISFEYDRPYEVMKFRLIKLFDMEEEVDKGLINELFEITRARVICLKSVLREYALDQTGCKYGFYTLSDDGFHYLCTHIVGCGKEAYEEAMNHPDVVIPKYVENNNFVEGFEYGFNFKN